MYLYVYESGKLYVAEKGHVQNVHIQAQERQFYFQLRYQWEINPPYTHILFFLKEFPLMLYLDMVSSPLVDNVATRVLNSRINSRNKKLRACKATVRMTETSRRRIGYF